MLFFGVYLQSDFEHFFQKIYIFFFKGAINEQRTVNRGKLPAKIFWTTSWSNPGWREYTEPAGQAEK